VTLTFQILNVLGHTITKNINQPEDALAIVSLQCFVEKILELITQKAVLIS
jgi:hypothetical protein